MLRHSIYPLCGLVLVSYVTLIDLYFFDELNENIQGWK